MKAITCSLFSYFQQHLFATLTTILTVLSFTGINLYLLLELGTETDDVQGLFVPLLITSVVMASIVAVHLKRLVTSSATALLPNFREYQVLAAGLILTVFVGMPVILMHLYGKSLLITLALFLFAASVSLRLFYRLGENPILFTGVVWPVRLAYELLGFETEVTLLNSFSNAPFFNNPSMVALALIFFSCIMIYRFLICYLMLSPEKYRHHDSTETDPWAKEHDQVDAFTGDVISRYLRRVNEAGMENRSSYLHSMRVQQIALFSPPNIYSISVIRFVAIIPVLATIIYFRDLTSLTGIEGRGLGLMYFIISFAITTDFLQHRNRLPMLYLQSKIHSRGAFARATILSYLTVILKQYLFVSVIISLILFGLPTYQTIDLLRLWVIGAIISITMVSISLLASEVITSPEAKGWIIATTLIFIVVFILLVKIWESLTWGLFGIVGCVSLGLFCLAVRKWERTELDYPGM